MFANILFLASNNVLACQNLGGCILALDGNEDFFDEVLHPFFQDKGSRGEESQFSAP
jgi:hypothetical protein